MRRLAGCLALLAPWSSIACLLLVDGVPAFSLTSRQAGLLTVSMAGALASGLLSLALGGGAALWAVARGAKGLRAAIPLLTLGAVMPPIITASSVLTLFSHVSPSLTQGWGPTVLVQGLTLAPLSALILILTFRSISGDEIESASVLISPASAYQKVIIPLSLQGALTALASASLLAALDFTVPTLFGLTTSMVEVYSDASSGTPILAAAWPHLLLSFGIASLAGVWLSRTSEASAGWRPAVWPQPPWLVRAWADGSWVLLGLAFVFLLVLLFVAGAFNEGGLAVASDSVPDLTMSLLLASGTAGLTALLGLLGGRELSSSRSWLVWAAVLAPACFPPALVGSAGVHLTSLLGLEGLLAPTLAQSLRFLPFAAALSALWWARSDSDVAAASTLFLPPAQRLVKATLPLLAPAVLTAFLLVFALSLGELGATLLVIPPGFSTLTLRLYNYLHYGSAPDSALLTLLLIGSAFLPLSVIPMLRRWSSA